MDIRKEEGDGHSNEYIDSIEKPLIHTPKKLQEVERQVRRLYKTFKFTREREYFDSNIVSEIMYWLFFLLDENRKSFEKKQLEENQFSEKLAIAKKSALTSSKISIYPPSNI